MSNHRCFGSEDFSANNQYLNPNPFVNIPPPPIPPRFPPPNIPFGPPNMPSAPPNMPSAPPNMPCASPNMPSAPPNMPSAPPNMPSAPLNMPCVPPNLPCTPPSMPSSFPNMPCAPPNTPSASLPASFPPPGYSNYQQMLPSTSRRPVYPLQSWGGLHPTSGVMDHPTFTTQHLETAQDWVDHWVKNKRKPEPAKSDIKIYAVKEKLDAAIKLIRELENSSRTLGVMVKTVSSAEWEQKCNEVEEKKKQLLILLSEVKLTEVEFKLLREKLSKRTKKRARLQRQSERLKRQKEEDKVKIQNLHFQIDNWQREMQEGVERVKREEELKKEADAVLWGVTQKKTEAKRQVAMLSALLTLRSVRVARLTAAGQPVSQSQVDTFNTVIERLKNMWSRHLEECQLEEQALRGMLGINTDLANDTMDAVKAHKKLVLNEWENAIFGSTGTIDSSLRGDELIDIRRGWDRFAVCDPSLLASAVPPGYVLPVPPSNDMWQTFLKY